MTTITITGDSGTTYTLTLDAEGRATGCTCPAARYRGPGCKHQARHNSELTRVSRTAPANPVTGDRIAAINAAMRPFTDPLSLIDEPDAA